MESFLFFILFPSLRKGPRFKQTWKELHLVANTNHVTIIKTWQVIMDLDTKNRRSSWTSPDTDIVDHPIPPDTKKSLVILDLATSRHHRSSYTSPHQDIMGSEQCDTKTEWIILDLATPRHRESSWTLLQQNVTKAMTSRDTKKLQAPRWITTTRQHEPYGQLQHQYLASPMKESRHHDESRPSTSWSPQEPNRLKTLGIG